MIKQLKILGYKNSFIEKIANTKPYINHIYVEDIPNKFSIFRVYIGNLYRRYDYSAFWVKST